MTDGRDGERHAFGGTALFCWCGEPRDSGLHVRPKKRGDKWPDDSPNATYDRMEAEITRLNDVISQNVRLAHRLSAECVERSNSELALTRKLAACEAQVAEARTAGRDVANQLQYRYLEQADTLNAVRQDHERTLGQRDRLLAQVTDLKLRLRYLRWAVKTALAALDNARPAVNKVD